MLQTLVSVLVTTVIPAKRLSRLRHRLGYGLVKAKGTRRGSRDGVSRKLMRK